MALSVAFALAAMATAVSQYTPQSDTSMKALIWDVDVSRGVQLPKEILNRRDVAGNQSFSNVMNKHRCPHIILAAQARVICMALMAGLRCLAALGVNERAALTQTSNCNARPRTLQTHTRTTQCTAWHEQRWARDRARTCSKPVRCSVCFDTTLSPVA
jgi:hypothetical protein